MDPKIVAAYGKIAVVMKTYRSGKLPKAFKVIPMVSNWEDLLFLTKPESWSCNATFQATKIFSSNMNGKMVQRFYSLILLPAVRENIATYKKLNCHLYMAIKKSMFKTGAFFKGFLIPLAEDASAREAVIVGSVLAKMSINTLDAAAAILKLSSNEYKIGSGFFLKTLLAKKYALPTVVVNTLIDFFCKFIDQSYVSEDGEEHHEMPVMWHQTLLTYVQCYRPYLSFE
jgi:essential nuclear protein 1